MISEIEKNVQSHEIPPGGMTAFHAVHDSVIKSTRRSIPCAIHHQFLAPSIVKTLVGEPGDHPWSRDFVRLKDMHDAVVTSGWPSSSKVGRHSFIESYLQGGRQVCVRTLQKTCLFLSMHIKSVSMHQKQFTRSGSGLHVDRPFLLSKELHYVPMVC